MCVVIDLDVVCLICLQPNKEMQSVFTTDVDSSELQIAQKISILSELKIDKNNHMLPSKICGKCLQDLNAAWRFRKHCQAAVTLFQTIVRLDVEQPAEEDANKELEEHIIKVPQNLQIQRIDQIIEEKEENKTSEAIRTRKKSSLDEFVIVNVKDSSTLYEELEPHEYVSSHEEETNEFQSLEDIGEPNEEQDNKEDEGEENELVEYYITEDGLAEKLSIKVETQTTSNSTTQPGSKKLKNKKALDEDESVYSVKIDRPTRRGRPRNSIKKQTEQSVKQTISRTSLLNSQKVLSKTAVEEANSSQDRTKNPQTTQVRQVKSRKRKSLSPETKPPKICEICGNSYRFQHALNAHMRRHYNDRPFLCEFCDKAFVSNVELRRHIRVHTGQKPYGCQYCERRFSDFGSRIKHERTHTGERPYVCVTCGKSFAYPHVLSVHLRTHTGEKRFRCDYCSKGFTKKVYLQSHVEQHHSGGPNSYENDEAGDSSQGKSIYTTEYINEESVDENTEFDEEQNQESDKIIIAQSRMTLKEDSSEDRDDDDEVNIHEIVEVFPDEYTISVR